MNHRRIMQNRYAAVAVMALLVFAAAAIAGRPTAQADNAASARVGFTILPMQTLTVLGSETSGGRSVTSTFFIPTPTQSDLQQGFIERAKATTLVATSNIPWAITVRSLDSDMGQSESGTYVKPISDLQVRAQGEPYVTISQNDQVIARGATGHYEIAVDYLVHFDRDTYQPGSYHITLVYTIAGE